jgi:hypothetical protein
VVCLYHCNVDKTGGSIDGNPNAEYKIAGIPNARIVNKTKDDGVRRPDGFLHCGCDEDVALMDFYLWKSWEATSAGISEGQRDKFMDPRTRFFVISQAYWNDARLDVDDMYSNGLEGPEALKIRLQSQVKRLSEKVRDLELNTESALDE